MRLRGNAEVTAKPNERKGNKHRHYPYNKN